MVLACFACKSTECNLVIYLPTKLLELWLHQSVMITQGRSYTSSAALNFTTATNATHSETDLQQKHTFYYKSSQILFLPHVLYKK